MLLLNIFAAVLSFFILIPTSIVKLSLEVIDKSKGGEVTKNKLSALKNKLYKQDNKNKDSKGKVNLTKKKDEVLNKVKKTLYEGVKYIHTVAKLTFLSSAVTASIVIVVLFFIVGALAASVGGFSQILNKQEEITSTATPNSATSSSTSSGESYSLTAGNWIAFIQSNYSESICSAATIAGEGCGWCSLSAMMTNLNPAKCKDLQPNDWLNILPQDVKNNWSSGGMGWSAPASWVNAINNLGTYGNWSYIAEGVVTGSPSAAQTERCINVIRQYAGDPNTCVILSTSSGLFTTGGHIVCCINYNSDSDTFNIIDSATRPVKLKVVNSREEQIGMNWPAGQTSFGGYDYSIKCAWPIRFNGN